MSGRKKNTTPGIYYMMKDQHRVIRNYMVEISSCFTGQNSLDEHTPWIQSDTSHDSAVIAKSEYSNQDLN